MSSFISGDLALLKATLMSFIFQKNHKPSYDSSIPYNVFERWEDGKKKYYFFIEGPIEVGQTVELLFLPPTPGVMLEGEWYEESRIWLAKEIDALSMKDLRSLLDFLHEEIGGSVYRSTLREFDTNLLGDEKVEFDLSAVSETIIARRRMHWSALRINAALQKGEAAIVPGIALIPLWSYDLVCRLRRHPAWAESLCRLLRTECSNEVMTEFKSTTTGNFWKTQEMWCSMAKELFQETVRLFAHFSAELDGFCSEQQLIDDISSMVSRAVSNLRQAMEQTPDKHSLAQLLMRVKDETLPPSNMFPSTLCLQATLTQGYLDSMALCDEPPFECPSKDELLFVATSGVKNITTHFQTLEDVHATNSKIDIFWYIRTQVMAVVENAAICGVANIALGGPSKIRDVCTLIRDSAKKALGSSDIAPFNFEICTTEKIHRSIAVPNILLGMTVPPKCQPNSGPIFLVTVWPVLKQAKWRIEGGAAPSSIIYFSPERKKDKRTRHVKQEAAIQRRKLARRTTQLGLGYVPKQVKRMFINCAAIDENIDEAPTVSEALHAFTQSLASIRGLDVISRTTKAVDYLAMLFEIVAPATIYETEARDVDLSNGTKWNESLTCGYLMRFLLVLPKMLNHLDLSIQQVESTTGVVSDLIAFLVENRKKWFGTSLQLPREEYETNYEFPKFILPHLEEAKAKLNEKRTKSETVPMSLKEVVLPSDRHELTDFVTTVLDQLIICRASTDDLRRKGRRAFLSLGCPGLMCRHCLGQYGEGKYFYSNMQSLSTAPTSIDKHIARCPKIHNEVKEKMIADKAKHSEQKASTPSGAQSAFFSRLWDRLQLSRGSIGTDADLYVTLHTTPTDMELDPDQHQNSAHSGSGVEFRNHVEIMEYIQTAAMWNSNADLLSAVEKYYSCLSFGGGIYNTTGMPPHYSSEWVLAKFGKASRLCESSVLER